MLNSLITKDDLSYANRTVTLGEMVLVVTTSGTSRSLYVDTACTDLKFIYAISSVY